MTQVLVVCAAGASSTFLARRLTDLASAAGLTWSFTPSSVDSIRDDSTAIVAVSAHVATPEVLDTLTTRGISHVVLPDTVRGGFGAEDALAEILSFLGNNDGHSSSLAEAQRVEGTN